jgi:hypothetical protein
LKKKSNPIECGHDLAEGKNGESNQNTLDAHEKILGQRKIDRTSYMKPMKPRATRISGSKNLEEKSAGYLSVAASGLREPVRVHA